MPKATEGFDPDSPGSRFTMRPSIGLVAGEDMAVRAERGERDVARTAFSTLVGPWIMESHPELGEGRLVDGAVGRGAAGWMPVLEWFLEISAAGVVGAAAWEAVRHASREARAVLDRIRGESKARFYVSRGLAALLAVEDVTQSGSEAGPLDIEAVEEPWTIGGDPPPEWNYVGVEPWIVLLVNRDRTARYVVVVRPDGTIAGRLRVEMGEFEGFFSRIPAAPE